MGPHFYPLKEGTHNVPYDTSFLKVCAYCFRFEVQKRSNTLALRTLYYITPKTSLVIFLSEGAADAYLEPYQTSMVGLFVKIVNG